MHVQARQFIEASIDKYGPFTGAVVEFGSQDVNGGVKDLFPNASFYLGIDIMPGPNVDLVIDVADWQPDKKYCCVVSTELFEHTARWPEILQVAAKALEPKGIILITCATNPRRPHSAHTDHARVKYGEYYGNVARHDFVQAAESAGLNAEVSIDQAHGDLYAVCRLKAQHG